MIARLLLSTITIIFYFILSLGIPILGYLVPYYKIRNVEIYGKKYSYIVNILVALSLLYIGKKFFLSENLLIVYLIFPYATEFLFYLFNRLALKNRFFGNLKLYDRIVLTSIITTILMTVYIYFNRESIAINIDEALKLIRTNQSFGIDIDITDLEESLIFIKNNVIVIIFRYMFLANIFLFLTLIAGTYNRWKLSWYWLVPFMIFVIGNRFYDLGIDMFIPGNIISIIVYIYLWYGIKTIYCIVESFGVKTSFLKHGISILIGLQFPLAVFVLGALASFEVIEFKVIKI